MLSVMEVLVKMLLSTSFLSLMLSDFFRSGSIWSTDWHLIGSGKALELEDSERFCRLRVAVEEVAVA